MTERIDHAAEALSCIGLIADIGYSSDEGYRKQEYLAEAQVHAMLALVEQQRIQNLIALSQAVDGNGWQAAEPLDAIYAYRNAEPEDEFAGLHVRPDIAAALGIEEASE